MSALTELVNSGESWAAERAQMAIQIEEAVKSGDLSADEAKELLTDLIDTEKLEEESTNAQVRAALVFAIKEAAALMASTI